MKNNGSDNVPNTFVEHIAPFEKTLFGFIKARLGRNHHDAEEVLQTVLNNGWLNMDQQRFQGRFKAWVYGIARNAIFDFLSKRAIKVSDETEYRESVKNDFHQKAECEDERIDDAWDILHSLPDLLQDVFYMKRVEEMTIDEIAEAIEKSPRRTRELLDQAQELVDAKVEKYLLGGFAAGVNGDYIHSLVQKIQAQAMELYPEAAFISASTTAATGTSLATAAEAVKQSFLGLCAAIALPFFWIMSLLIGTQFCGAAFVQNAPTLQARRWIVKHLLHCYCGIVVFPVVFYMLNKLIHHYLLGGRFSHQLVSTFNWITFGTVLLYIAWMRDAYLKIVSNGHDEEKETETILSYKRQQTHVSNVFFATTVIIAIFFTWFFAAVVESYVAHTPNSNHVFFSTFLFMFGACVFHFGAYTRFQQFLSLCRDEETFEKTAPGSGPRVRDISTILLCIFAGFTVMPSVLHLLLQRKLIVFSIAEIIVAGWLWFFLYRYNARVAGHREIRVAAMFLVQLVVMQFIRDLFFLP